MKTLMMQQKDFLKKNVKVVLRDFSIHRLPIGARTILSLYTNGNKLKRSKQ